MQELTYNIFKGGKGMNKKALACLLAAAMTISLTACGGGDKKTSDKA